MKKNTTHTINQNGWKQSCRWEYCKDIRKHHISWKVRMDRTYSYRGIFFNIYAMKKILTKIMQNLLLYRNVIYRFNESKTRYTVQYILSSASPHSLNYLNVYLTDSRNTANFHNITIIITTETCVSTRNVLRMQK